MTISTNDQRARAAVQLLRRLTRAELAQVVKLMPELSSLPPVAEEAESTKDYWRRALREERGGYQPTLDDEFLEGLTYRDYFAMSEAEQNSFWNKLFAKEARLDKEPEETDVRPDIAVAVGQKRRSPRAQRTGKARTRTTSRRRPVAARRPARR